MQDLLEELNTSNASTNVLKIRLLCREHPGLIADSNLRVKIWTLFLLGFQGAVLKNRHIFRYHHISSLYTYQIMIKH